MSDNKNNHNNEITRTLKLEEEGGARSKAKPLMLLLGAAVLAIVAFQYFSAPGARQVEYRTHGVQKGDLTLLVTATGNLEPTNQVDVGIEVSGTVKSVDVDYNDEVKVGQVLARLDTAKLEAQMQQAKAALEAAKARLLQVQATVKETGDELARLKRVKQVGDSNLVSEQQMDAAEAAYQRAKADEQSADAAILEARSTLTIRQTDLTKAVIYSPIDGIVLKRAVEPGQTVAASFQAPVLFTLAQDLTKMELHVDVDEADVGLVSEGLAAVFTVDAYPERTFSARITQVRYAPQQVEGVITYETLLEVDNSALLLRPGMTATADIRVKHITDALLVPNTALRYTPPVLQASTTDNRSLLGRLMPRPPHREKSKETNGDEKQQTLWVLKDGHATAVNVIMGVTDGTQSEILQGDIKQGELVITGTLSQGAQ